MTLLRYLDVSLVVAAAPIFLLGNLPALGYLVAAVAWLLTRWGLELVQRRASRTRNPGLQAALVLGGMMARVLVIAAAVLIARFAGNTDDGIAAAAVALAAFTVQLLVTLLLRGGHTPRGGQSGGHTPQVGSGA